jgi:hypothetical protein
MAARVAEQTTAAQLGVGRKAASDTRFGGIGKTGAVGGGPAFQADQDGLGTSRLATPKSYNDFCSAFLPRCSRLMTVPIGISKMSAISL